MFKPNRFIYFGLGESKPMPTGEEKPDTQPSNPDDLKKEHLPVGFETQKAEGLSTKLEGGVEKKEGTRMDQTEIKEGTIVENPTWPDPNMTAKTTTIYGKFEIKDLAQYMNDPNVQDAVDQAYFDTKLTRPGKPDLHIIVEPSGRKYALERK
ncbi:hypothetical protein GF376_04800 [Candidatus Peregrinibacteria bacterium]|nr:hypothetical protein [Candidatus Peregrinibacteria bacterium]